MPVYRDEAVVLRAQKLGEADRIVTLLTRERGKVRAAAKGVRRTSSRFGARLEPFMLIDVQLYTGRTLDVVTQAETVGPFARAIIDDYALYTAGAAMLETAERLTEEGEPSVQQYWLLVGALRALAEHRHGAGLVLDSYLLRALSVAGWAPSFTECARCGEPGPHRAFSVATGGAVCSRCRPPGSPSPAPETFALLAALLAGDWDVADASGARHRSEASGLVAAYSQYHLERRLRSLRLVERETDVGAAEADSVQGPDGPDSAHSAHSAQSVAVPPARPIESEFL
ncbi:DNA repair protein RecO [Luteimicrobium subarcticum]|uniref:DNA repair protein RecO n=1 Tax=Luteimicrobium subarcticum TaxID=620910 RepID=A0A2M8WR10_9MICO|nr:DNA repair protein RecO [Luteimicrobium subarcticum]PJI93370.1 DNA replication and repair protein RecO [Luteimicrobium subarcticum]